MRAGRMLVLLAATMLAANAAGPAVAQDAAAQASRAIAISAGPLTRALNQLASQTGMQILFDAALAQGKATRGVRGDMTPRQALSAVLAGTGLGVRVTASNAITIVGAASAAGPAPAGAIPLDTIDVQGQNPNAVVGNLPPPYAGGQVATGGQAGFLGNRSVMDMPFNQTSYTSKLIQDQQARTLADVMDNEPSIRTMEGAGSGLENFYIRGFPVYSSDVGMNGLYGVSLGGPIGTSFVERVEVLKGPSALLNGMPPGATIGGAINLVTKRAGDEPLTQLTASYASRSHFGTHIDVGRRFGEGNACGVRFNGLFENGETSIENNKNRIGQAALGLDCRGDRFRVSADLIYQANRTDGITRFTFFTPGLQVLPAPNASKLYTPTWWKFDTTEKVGMINAEYDIAPNLTAYAAVGGLSSLYPQVNGFPTVTDALGNFTADPRGGDYFARSLSAQAGLRGTFTTGPVDHAVNVNVSTQDTDYGGNSVWGTSFSGNIYNPTDAPYQNLQSPPGVKYLNQKFNSFGVADTLSILDKRVQFTVGVRRQQIETTSFDATGLATPGYDEGAWSPAYALVVKPLQNVSLYANYIEGLQPGMVVSPGFANEGQVFPPYQSKQYEAGIKVDWGRVTTTASVFEITQPATVVVPGFPLQSLTVDGENRNRGLELFAFGALTDELRLLGGVTFIDGRQVRTSGGIDDGKKAIGVPEVQVNLGGEWDTPFLRGFTVNGRVIYTSSQYISTDNTQFIPDWTRVDLGARYTFEGPWRKPIVVRFDVRNVFDRNYWATVNGGYVGIGLPRTFLLSTTFNF